MCTAKTEKNERIPRSTKLSPEKKAQLVKFAAEKGCDISLGCFSTVTKTHGAS